MLNEKLKEKIIDFINQLYILFDDFQIQPNFFKHIEHHVRSKRHSIVENLRMSLLFGKFELNILFKKTGVSVKILERKVYVDQFHALQRNHVTTKI